MPFDAVGGMQAQTFRQTTKLAEFGIQQTVLTLKIPGTPAVWQLNDSVVVRGVRVPVLPLRSRIRGLMDLNISWALGIAHEMVSRRISCDIVHVHCSGVFWPLLVGILVARVLKAQLVLTVHCSVLATYEPMNILDHAIQPFSRYLERKALNNAAHVVALSQRSRDALLRQTNMNPGIISVVPDSIDVEQFRSFSSSKSVADFRERFNLPSDRPIIAYVGRIAREKGWRTLIEIAERLKHLSLHYLVCGDGNERDLLEREIRQRSLSNQFTITGYLPQESIPSALRCSSVLVLTSLHEEFGGVLIEAMAMQVPQVAFAVGGIPNVIADGETGLLISPHDIDTLARAVERLLLDRELAERMGEAGLARVRENFGLATACHRINDIYRSVLFDRAKKQQIRSHAIPGTTLF